MPARELSARPNLEQYKKQAKELLDDIRSDKPDAIDRLQAHHPHPVKFAEARTSLKLADAQVVLAREHGFDSWTTFAARIAELSGQRSPDTIWREAERAVLAGDVAALERLLRDDEAVLRRAPRWSWVGHLTQDGLGMQRASGAPLDARAIIAAKHHFENWDQFAAFTELRRDAQSPVARFEAAVDAVVTGDATALDASLRLDPDLIRARSLRTHRSTLLLYVGSNGVEGYRQRTPKNAVEIATRLLDAGAEIDAIGEMYRGTTTLGLVATSVHPVNTGVQGALIDLLLSRGASLDRAVAPDYTDGRVVNACLANGRPEAAEYLAQRGAPLDLEGAAGVGNLSRVTSFFTQDNRLKPDATTYQQKSAFNWACAYGHLPVVEFLLGTGIDIGERHRGETGLHQAALGGHAHIVDLLLARGAPVDVMDETWGTTPLAWALFGCDNKTPEETPQRYYDTIAGLIHAGATVTTWMLEQGRVETDQQMLAILRRQA
jgi:hypothetical protein